MTNGGGPAEEQGRLADLFAAQGTVFIQEFLRNSPVAHSGSKSQIRDRVLDAIVEGKLHVDDLREWVASVEGWGAQYVQLAYATDGGHLPPDYDEAVLAERLAGTEFEELVGQLDSVTFPDKLTPTGAVFREGRVTLTWHVRADKDMRTPSQDRIEPVEGDTYKFKAYRVVPERHTIRLVLDQTSQLCGVFVSVPRSSSIDPTVVIDSAWQHASSILGAAPTPLDLHRAIATLANSDDDALRAKRRRMAASGAEVSFSTVAATDDYRDSPEVSQIVTTAAAVQGLVNRAGDFRHQSAQQMVNAPTRQVAVSVDQERGHIWVPAQVAEEQMWSLCDLVATASTT